METDNKPNTPQPDRTVSLKEARAMVARRSFWRPEAEPRKLRFTALGASAMKAGANKWGRPQFFADVILDDGSNVSMAMSRRCLADLFLALDENGLDEKDLDQLILKVVRNGRGLQTTYGWQCVGSVDAPETVPAQGELLRAGAPPVKAPGTQ